jgi:HD-GYP domain-containing protein (c-di-GMP phosphodiesterase class II)
MGLEPSFEEQQLLADTLRRASSDMTRRERLAEGLVGVGFVAAAAGLWWLSPPHAFAPSATIWCVVVMVLATRVRFDTPFGFTVATQLAGRVRPGKLLRTPGNSWFAIGPVLVFALADVHPRHAGPWLLVAALAAQFAGDFAVSALRFGIARGATILSQLRDSWVYVIDAALSGVGLVVAEQINSTPAAVFAVVPLLGLLAMFARERRQRLRSLLELNDTYRGTALLLGDVISADDGYTGEHTQGVVGLALAVGDLLGLDAERRRNLEFGARLHDIGKITIPKAIINKPGPLDAAEWTLIKTHTLAGEKMLSRVGGFMREVGKIVRAHHEQWDGTGYPDHLAGRAIPLEARIISCCDAWNAMRTDRSYRAALSHEVALSEMLRNAGSQFDPDIVHALVGIVAPAASVGTAEGAAAPERHPTIERVPAEPVSRRGSTRRSTLPLRRPRARPR